MGCNALLPLLLLFLWSTGACNYETKCRFAHDYDTAALLAGDDNATSSFLNDYIDMESNFMHLLGIDEDTMMTYDGQRLDYNTGMPIGQPKKFSAASKESLHVLVLSKALDGNTLAQRAFTTDQALAIARTKVASYKRFFATFPGFGGFFPWYSLDNTFEPTWDWENRVPALDNGELFWAAFALANILKEKYPEEKQLAQDWDGVWQTMTQNALAVFYDGSGYLRTETAIGDQSLPVEGNTYTCPDSCGFLNDPYEGELFTVMVYLFTNLSTTEKELLWENKRDMLVQVNVTLDDIPAMGQSTMFSVERGFWYSAHEKWKYLLLPYTRSKTNNRVFINGERFRSAYARSVSARGMWASSNGPVPDSTTDFEYFSDCGIEAAALNPVTHDDVITPYGVYPIFLANFSVAAGWLHHMMLIRKAQNCFGTTESFNIDGTMVAPLTTWDSKITTLAAVLGGLADTNAKYLNQTGLLDQFVNIIEAEWSKKFPLPLAGENIEFFGPHSRDAVPDILDDFTTCNETVDQCSGSGASQRLGSGASQPLKWHDVVMPVLVLVLLSSAPG